MPYNFLCVEAGCLLSELSSAGDIFSLGTTLKLTAGAIATLVPGLLLQRYQQQQRQSLLVDNKTNWCVLDKKTNYSTSDLARNLGLGPKGVGEQFTVKPTQRELQQFSCTKPRIAASLYSVSVQLLNVDSLQTFCVSVTDRNGVDTVKLSELLLMLNALWLQSLKLCDTSVSVIVCSDVNPWPWKLTL